MNTLFEVVGWIVLGVAALGLFFIVVSQVVKARHMRSIQQEHIKDAEHFRRKYGDGDEDNGR